jgi:hypothetical protein
MTANPNAVAALAVGLDPNVLARLQALDPNFGRGNVPALAAGVRSPYAIIGYKGKVWTVRYNGETRQVLRETQPGMPPEPEAFLDVVIVDASPMLSKTFYASGYVEGSTEAPDCSSINGITPDAGVKAKQAETCALCPQNVWGSSTNESTGKKGKACSDGRRIAVVPIRDITNESFGGPMMLRIPPASLQAGQQYASKLAPLGVDTHMVATRISFDVKEAYPSFVFTAIRVLTPDEFATVLKMRETSETKAILYNSTAGADVPALPPPDNGRADVSAVQGIAPPVAPPAAAAPLPGATPTPPAPPPAPPAAAAPAPAPTPPAPPPAPAPEPEPAWTFSPDGKLRWRPGMAGWEPVPAMQAPEPTPTPPAPPPAPPAAAAPPPAPAPEPEPAWTFSPDGKLRWRPGMAGWEPVPVPASVAGTSETGTSPAALDDMLAKLGVSAAA